MEIMVDNLKVKVEDRLPSKGQIAFFDNKLWKVSELWGSEIMHLERPIHQESISLYGKDIFSAKKAMILTLQFTTE